MVLDKGLMLRPVMECSLLARGVSGQKRLHLRRCSCGKENRTESWKFQRCGCWLRHYHIARQPFMQMKVIFQRLSTMLKISGSAFVSS